VGEGGGEGGRRGGGEGSEWWLLHTTYNVLLKLHFLSSLKAFHTTSNWWGGDAQQANSQFSEWPVPPNKKVTFPSLWQ